MHYSHAIKVPATIIGFGFLGAEMASNIALFQEAGPVMQAITGMVTFAGALAPVFAEHLWAAGHRAKACGLMVFFTIVVGVSLTAALERTSGRLDNVVAAHDMGVSNKALAESAVTDAARIQKRDCRRDGSTACKRAERNLARARKTLAEANGTAAAASGDGGNKRIAQILGVPEESVRLWMPWLIPLAVLLGAWLFLGVGLSPPWEQRPHAVEPASETKSEAVAAETAPAVTPLPDSAVALRRLCALLESCGGMTRKSGNQLAEELGYAKSTFALWLKRWSDPERDDRPILREEGWIKLPQRRRRRA